MMSIRQKLNQGHWLKWNWNATATYQFEIGKHRMDVLRCGCLKSKTQTLRLIVKVSKWKPRNDVA
ncbi:MAG: hypothetical protein ACLUHA_11725 [Bacteroides stercoris]